VVAEALASHPDFELRPLSNDLTRLAAEGIVTKDGAERLSGSVLKDGFLRTIPGVHNCDGFFAALLIRN